MSLSFNVANSTFYRKYYLYFSHTEAGFVHWYRFFRLAKLSILWILSRFYFSKKELSKHEYDIVHLNSSVLTDWLWPCSKKGKVVYHVQEPLTKGLIGVRYAFFRKQVKEYAAQIIAISKDNAERVNIPGKTQIIYNYAVIPETAALEKSYSSKKILYLGGAAFIKGFYALVDALDYLDKSIKIYFGGNYPSPNKSKNIVKIFFNKISYESRKKKKAIEKMRNHPNAVEIGMIDNIDDFLNKSCCLISSFSVPHFSRPVIEAYLHQKAAIGSDVSGMEEIIKHGKTGLIVPRNNPKALAAAINFISADSKKAKEFGINGYNDALERFTSDNCLKFEKIYEGLTN